MTESECMMQFCAMHSSFSVGFCGVRTPVTLLLFVCAILVALGGCRSDSGPQGTYYADLSAILSQEMLNELREEVDGLPEERRAQMLEFVEEIEAELAEGVRLEITGDRYRIQNPESFNIPEQTGHLSFEGSNLRLTPDDGSEPYTVVFNAELDEITFHSPELAQIDPSLGTVIYRKR